MNLFDSNESVEFKKFTKMILINPFLREDQSHLCLLTLQEGVSGIDIKKGGAFNARSYKNPFKGPFGPIFLHRKGWGIKITSENFFEIGF